MKDNDGAFPLPKINSGGGFTKREYAAILLAIPDSGLEWLDKMIIKSHMLKK